MLNQWRTWLRQRRAAKTIVSRAQWEYCEARLPFLSHLTTNERHRLREMSLEFIAEKEMNSAQGLTLRPDMQISIALQACLLILNLGLDWYRGWTGIIIYPGDFVIPRQEMDDDGVVHEFNDVVMGESWQDGPVLLSWQDTSENPDGINVVIHEFAHKLDMRNGSANGMPPLNKNMSHHEWHSVFQAAYTDFRARINTGMAIGIDHYAADSPAEFFAVMSEVFFESPQLLRNEYPDVFAKLQDFYHQNPLTTY